MICENDGEPGCMGTPTALLHTELVDSQEYLPGSEIIFCKKIRLLKVGKGEYWRGGDFVIGSVCQICLSACLVCLQTAQIGDRDELGWIGGRWSR